MSLRRTPRDSANVLRAISRNAQSARDAALEMRDLIENQNAQLLQTLQDASTEYRRAVFALRRVYRARSIETAHEVARDFLDSIL